MNLLKQSKNLLKPLLAHPLQSISLTQRSFLSKLQTLSNLEEPSYTSSNSTITPWEKSFPKQDTSLILESEKAIEEYVLQIIRDYFRSTNKSNIKIDSWLKDHGLDSLDRIELVMTVEDDLGFIIDAENLEKFQKPKHFVNFITMMEKYRQDYGELPLENVNVDFSMKDAFPLGKKTKQFIRKITPKALRKDKEE